ncbi:ABC transporter permease [Larkinella soli]|uniref:ABC transporter permease n=1 Tax=Larkinella soli TaxID=1770527 RepID=UPI000FFC3131|nr:ABC transporter permease [Larkinella soli]
MFFNYLKITLRNLWRNQVYSAVNILGLAVGIASFLLITLFVKDELNFDRFLPGADRIYQVNLFGNFGGTELKVNASPPPVGRTMQTDYPEVEAYTRTFEPIDVVVQREQGGKIDKSFTEANILAVDSNFLDVFRFPVLAGQAVSCLREPTSVVITETTARKYFGTPDVLGRTLKINGNPHQITAVLADLPTRSTLQFDFLTPLKNYQVVTYFDWSWVWLNVNTFVRLAPQVAAQPERVRALEAKFPQMVRTHAAQAFARIGQPLEEFYRKGGHWDFRLQPLTDIHLHSADLSTGFTNLGDAGQTRTFVVVALFIVVLACVNFMNLSTARSVRRAKEVGVRKVLGSQKTALIRQFLTESLLYSVLGTLLALMLVSLSMPLFNQLAGKAFTTNDLLTPDLLAVILGLTVVVGLLAGSYPAFYLTAFNPIETLKNGLLKTAPAHRLVRNGLVVFQFAVSTALIIGTVVVFGQLRYSQTKDLGLDKENVLVITNVNRLNAGGEAFRQELKRFPEVLNASFTTSIPLKGGFGDFYVPQQTKTDRQVAKDLTLYSFMTDYDLVPTLKIKLLKGRNFSPDFSDSLSVILNETAVKTIGWKDPIGKTLMYPGGRRESYTVVGVMKDFDMQTVRSPMVSFGLFHTSSKSYTVPNPYLAVRVRGGSLEAALKRAEAQWKRFAPDTPFDYTFLDNEFAQAYRTDRQTGRVVGIFTALAIFIACLGLFGLTTFAAEQRMKEIGVRKVLGASVASVVLLLSKDFLKLVLIAIAVGAPIAWYGMQRWLKNFAYRIDLEWWMFAGAGGLAVGIALLTVSFQSVRAALMNPVKSLRSE